MEVVDIFDYMYIDYENVQDIKFEFIENIANINIKIIVGQNQNKIPIELVQLTQRFGNSIEWIKVNGVGKNALDFFITFFLGRDITLNKDKKFIIYSKDTGYDPLINYLNSNKINIKRISSIEKISN